MAVMARQVDEAYRRLFAKSMPYPDKERKTIYDIPQQPLMWRAAKLYALVNIAWDYIDTICDIVIQQRRSATKSITREVRELKRSYDRFRGRLVDAKKFDDKERKRAEAFEDLITTDLTKLFYSLRTEIKKIDLVPNDEVLVIAVQQAMTILDAVMLYGRDCDKYLNDQGVWADNCVMLQPEVLAVYDLVPHFAGDCYQPNLQARKLTAKIIVNRLIQI